VPDSPTSKGTWREAILSWPERTRCKFICYITLIPLYTSLMKKKLISTLRSYFTWLHITKLSCCNADVYNPLLTMITSWLRQPSAPHSRELSINMLTGSGRDRIFSLRSADAIFAAASILKIHSLNSGIPPGNQRFFRLWPIPALPRQSFTIS